MSLTKSSVSKAKPGVFNYSSPGAGTDPHMAAELFKVMAKIDLEQVPFKGSGLGMISLIGGEVSVAFPTTPTVMPYLKNNRLRPLGVTSVKRAQVLPDVPTFKELGYPELVGTTWFSLSGPAKLPADIVQKLNAEITRIVALPDVQARLRRDGFIAQPMNPAQFTKFVDDENKRWKPLIEAAGLAGKGG